MFLLGLFRGLFSFKPIIVMLMMKTDTILSESKPVLEKKVTKKWKRIAFYPKNIHCRKETTNYN